MKRIVEQIVRIDEKVGGNWRIQGLIPVVLVSLHALNIGSSKRRRSMFAIRPKQSMTRLTCSTWKTRFMSIPGKIQRDPSRISHDLQSTMIVRCIDS